jgi:hypothetical protein
MESQELALVSSREPNYSRAAHRGGPKSQLQSIEREAGNCEIGEIVEGWKNARLEL